ncbi:MAG: acyltransferase [Blastocatellia bacterium]
MGYVNAFFGYEWIIPVFWTLAIEFQFYLLMAASLPLLMSPRTGFRTMAALLFGAGAFLMPSSKFIFGWLFLFLLGITVAQYKSALIGKRMLLIVLPLLVAGTWFTQGWLIALVGTATALAILLLSLQSRVLFFLGSISYSLYLIHVPIGGRVINLGMRLTHTLPSQLGVLAVALTVSIGAAYLLYRFVERPAQEWSSRIQYQ